MKYSSFSDYLLSVKESKYTVLVIIYLAFFLDNMLLTVVVPIIPDFLHTTNIKLLPKSAFYDNIENLWIDTEKTPLTELTTTEYPTLNISSFKNLHNYKTPNQKTSTREEKMIKPLPTVYKTLKETNKFKETPLKIEPSFYKTYKGTRTVDENALRIQPSVQNSVGIRVLGSKEDLEKDNEEIERENGPVGVLLSSKALVQLFLNPVVGIWTTKIGYKVPIFFGSVNLLLASLLFAYGESYMSMLLARSVQGVSSACIGVSGMCLAASTFRTDSGQRSRAMGILLGGGALGVTTGYPIGGFLYEFVGKTAPFFIIAILVSLTLGMQDSNVVVSCQEIGACTGEPRKSTPWTGRDKNKSFSTIESETNTVWWPLLSDGVIIVVTGAIFISTSAMAILEPCLPIWLMTHLKPEKWQVGTVFIPDSLGYLLGTNLFGAVAIKVGQWKVSVIALLTIGVAAFIIPTATSLGQLLLPHFGLGLGIGALDAALVPLLATLVESRHGACYGAVFSLQQTAVSLAYSIAPLVGGALARGIGFAWTLRRLGLLNALYSPLLAALAWKLNSSIQSSRLLDSHSSDCENLNQAISMATYGTAYE